MRKQRFWLYRRDGIYYIHDSETSERESLHTRSKQEAEQIRATRNMTAERPVIGMSPGSQRGNQSAGAHLQLPEHFG